MAEDLAELIHAGFSADEENESDLEETVTCLFSSETFPSLTLAKEHLIRQYSFDIDAFVRSNRLTEIQTMSMINFIRSTVASGGSAGKPVTPESVIELIDSEEGRQQWLQRSEEFLKPVLECDAFLYGLQSYDESANETSDEEGSECSERVKRVIKTDITDHPPTIGDYSEHTSSDDLSDHIAEKSSKVIRPRSQRSQSMFAGSIVNQTSSLSDRDENGESPAKGTIAIERSGGGRHRRSVTVVRRRLPLTKMSAVKETHDRGHSRAMSMDSVTDLKLTADMIHESTDREIIHDGSVNIENDDIDQSHNTQDIGSDDERIASDEISSTVRSRKSTAIALDSSGDEDGDDGTDKRRMDEEEEEEEAGESVSAAVMMNGSSIPESGRHFRSQTAVLLTSDDGESQIKVTRDHHHVSPERSISPISHVAELQSKNDCLIRNNRTLLAEVARLRQLLKDSLNDDSNPDDVDDDDDKDETKRVKVGSSLIRSAAKGTAQKVLRSDEVYFDSYSTVGIHEEMLRDRHRTIAYQLALSDQTMIKDKVILDVGCGTGILSMFAAKYGRAKKVYGIDMAEIIHAAKQCVSENDLSEQITLCMGKCEEINELNDECKGDSELSMDIDGRSEKKKKIMVDVIVSEWMGYFLLFENMLESVIYARDQWLKPDGIVLPHTARMYMAGMDGSRFWSDRCYGLDLSPVYRWSRHRRRRREGGQSSKQSCSEMLGCSEPMLLDVCSKDVMTEWCCFKSIDCQSVTKDELDFTVDFSLKVIQCSSDDSGGECDSTKELSTIKVDGLVCYFDTVFSETNVLSTAPLSEDGSESTHWHQTVFDLPSAIECSVDDEIQVKMECVRLESNPRHYQVRLKVAHESSGFSKDLIYFLE